MKKIADTDIMPTSQHTAVAGVMKGVLATAAVLALTWAVFMVVTLVTWVSSI